MSPCALEKGGHGGAEESSDQSSIQQLLPAEPQILQLEHCSRSGFALLPSVPCTTGQRLSPNPPLVLSLGPPQPSGAVVLHCVSVVRYLEVAGVINTLFNSVNY